MISRGFPNWDIGKSLTDTHQGFEAVVVSNPASCECGAPFRGAIAESRGRSFSCRSWDGPGL